MSIFGDEIKAAPDTTNPLSLLAHFHQGPRLRRAMTGYAMGLAAWQVGKKTREWWRGRYEYTVSITSKEDIYTEVQERLLAMIPEKNRRALLAAALRGNRRINAGAMEIAPMGYVEPEARLATYYDGDTSQTFTLEGHKVSAQITKEAFNLDDARTGGDSFFRNERLRFITHTEGGRAAVLRWLESIVAERDEDPAPRFYLMSRWGGSWDRRTDLIPRVLDSVILRAGQIGEIADDMQTFLGWRDDYLRYGIPYHRGYLFHGPPGTGKTSLAQALAAHFGLDMYYAPLADMDKDTNLLHLISQVTANSVLLLEDVDVFHAATQRNDDKEGVSLSGLLNALDGVSTPSGIITIMTTNDLSALDSALIRPGRVDRLEEIGYVDDEQLARLVAMVVDEPVTLPSVGTGTVIQVTPAEVMEVFKRHLHDPKLGLDPLRRMLEEKHTR